MSKKNRVVIAMSGGVDSSVAAALLVEQGYDVIGVMLRLWSEPGMETSNRCCTPNSILIARRVAEKINIPFYALDARDIFYQKVVKNFISGYEKGITPNPCIFCNRDIRWGYLFEYSKKMGAEYFATGHYAQIHKNSLGKYQLRRALDRNKDQSYVLHMLSQDQLQGTIFPLGKFTKNDVRDIARKINLPVAFRSESQDLCFIGNNDYRDFLIRNSSNVENPGIIMVKDGKVLGNHRGLAFYTIGQRRGLGVSYQEPLYVIGKIKEDNILIVGTTGERGKKVLSASQVNWIAGIPPDERFRASVKIRYKSREIRSTINVISDNELSINLDEKVGDITPGQAVVFYDGDICLGGGLIQENNQKHPFRI